MATHTPKTVYLKDYTPPPFLIDEVDMRFELGEESTLVTSTLALRRNPAGAEPRERPGARRTGIGTGLHFHR